MSTSDLEMTMPQKAAQQKRTVVSGEGPRERLLAGMPVEERRLTCAGIATAVLEGGEGPPRWRSSQFALDSRTFSQETSATMHGN